MKKKITVITLTLLMTLSMCSTAFAGRDLYYGISGDDVYSLQQMLYAYGYFYDEPTGYFGDVTESALMAFQYDFGLEADGVAGPITNSYLGLSTSYDDDDDDGDYYTGGSSLSRTLSYDMEGDDVYTLQELLTEYGYFYSYATGYFGELTQYAVMAFQEDYGLDVDGVVGPMTIGALTGSPVSGSSSGSGVSWADYQARVLAAVEITPTTAQGYCAEWISNVFINAGILTYNLTNLRPTYYSYASTSGLADWWYSDNAGFNANDYWAYVCTSSDLDDLQPGMIVATRSSFSYLGKQFGHVGIYLGDGMVISSVGYLETLSLDEWNRRYNNTAMGSTIAWGYLPF